MNKLTGYKFIFYQSHWNSFQLKGVLIKSMLKLSTKKKKRLFNWLVQFFARNLIFRLDFCLSRITFFLICLSWLLHSSFLLKFVYTSLIFIQFQLQYTYNKIHNIVIWYFVWTDDQNYFFISHFPPFNCIHCECVPKLYFVVTLVSYIEKHEI